MLACTGIYYAHLHSTCNYAYKGGGKKEKNRAKNSMKLSNSTCLGIHLQIFLQRHSAHWKCLFVMTHSWPAQIDSVVLRLLLSLHRIVHSEADEYQ